MICLDSEARQLKQRPFSGLVNKNTGAGHSPILSSTHPGTAVGGGRAWR